MVGFHDPDGFDAMTQCASELGKEFACIRVYMRPSEWGTVTPEFQQVVGAGKLAVASHKVPKASDAWANVVRGVYDAEIAAIIDAHKNAAIETIFLFNHEPHDECSDLGHDPDKFRGSSSEYVTAFQYIVQRFRAANATNVRLGYCGTDPGIFTSPDLCYPGHEYVDVLCHDLYNWGDFRSERDAWTEFDDPSRWPKAVALAKAAGKPMVIGEFGCHPSAPTHPANPQHDRNQWFRHAAAYLRNDSDAGRHVIGFCYFHSPPQKYDFQFLRGPTAPDGKDGWIEAFSHDDYFTGKPRPISL
jgi:hypothetical protein